MKAVPLYAALVGIPIAILIGVLRFGRGLEAPPAVAGVWAADSAALTLRIVQSGIYADVELRRPGSLVTLEGRLRGGTLRADPAAPGGCPSLALQFASGPRPAEARAAPAPECGMPALRLRRVGPAGER